MMRTALWQESVTFLRGDDVAAITLLTAGIFMCIHTTMVVLLAPTPAR
jgi:hypothetical protein